MKKIVIFLFMFALTLMSCQLNKITKDSLMTVVEKTLEMEGYYMNVYNAYLEEFENGNNVSPDFGAAKDYFLGYN